MEPRPTRTNVPILSVVLTVFHPGMVIVTSKPLVLSATSSSYLFCRDFGVPCDCTLSYQCEEATYASCCGASTPCDCRAGVFPARQIAERNGGSAGASAVMAL